VTAQRAGAGAELWRIGEAAERAGVSPRTLRYYEELGLLVPSGRSEGGARRYSAPDVARLLRIRELQELLGLDLGAIGEVLRAEDELAALRRQYRGGDVDPDRRRAIIGEALAINARMRGVVRAKQERLHDMMRELEATARRYRARSRELSADAAPGPGRTPARGARGAPTPPAPARPPGPRG